MPDDPTQNSLLNGLLRDFIGRPKAAAAPSAGAPDVGEIEQMLPGIRQRAPVLGVASALIQGRTQPLDGMQPVFTALANRSPRLWRERVVAAWLMGHIPLTPNERDAGISMLLDALEDNETAALRRRRRRALFILAVCSLILSPIVSIGGPPEPVRDLAELVARSLAACVALAPFFIIAVSLSARRHRARVATLRAAAARALGRLQAVEGIGALAGALSKYGVRESFALFDTRTGHEVNEAAAMALHEALPAVTAEHYGTLGAQTLTNLGHALTYPDTSLAYRVLHAIEKAGTGSAIPIVEKAMREGRTTRLRDLAADVLETLRDRHQREEEARALLRGSAAPPPSHDTLLRPGRATSFETEQLLRADLRQND